MLAQAVPILVVQEISAPRGLLLGASTMLWVDLLVPIGTAAAAIATASALLGRLTR